MNRRFVIGCVAVFWAGAVWGQCPGGTCPPAEPGSLAGPPHPAVARIASFGLDGTRCYGTGTLVHKDAAQGIVLTCAHLFRSSSPRVRVTFPDGQSLDAELLAVDRAWDLGVLRLAAPTAQPVSIAAQGPKPGELLASCGYGPSGRYWCNQGRALGYAQTATTSTYETLALSGLAREGDSGGPVFNAQGELVAVLWGTDGRSVQGTYCGRIRKFLRQVLGIGDAMPASPWPGPAPWDHGERPAPPPNAPSTLPHIDEFVAELARIKKRLDTHEQSSGQRLEQIEAKLGLTRDLQSRVEKAEKAVAQENLRATIREVLSTVAVEHGPRLVETALPALLQALGWTGPPSVAVMLAARAVMGVARRRLARRPSAGRGMPNIRPSAPQAAPQPRTILRRAGHLLRRGGARGDPLADAVLGRHYHEELARVERGEDRLLAHFARNLRRRVAQRLAGLGARSRRGPSEVSAGGTSPGGAPAGESSAGRPSASGS